MNMGKRILKVFLLIMIIAVIGYRFYFEMYRMDKDWWFNYLDQSDYRSISYFAHSDIEPKEKIEWDTGEKLKKIIYVYNDWYDVFNCHEEDDKMYYACTVITSDFYKMGPWEISVGTSKQIVNMAFSLTNHTKNKFSIEVPLVLPDGKVENHYCRGYYDTKGGTGGFIGFLFENDIVANIVFIPGV